MNWFESILIMVGIGLDVFATFEIQGAMLASIKKRTLAITSAIVCAIQLVFYFAGYIICRLLDYNHMIEDSSVIGEILASIILALLGIRFVVKAIKRDFVHERRKDGIRVWDYIRILVVSSCYTFAAGCAYGLLGTSMWAMFLILLLSTIIMVVGGIYTGIHFGFEIKTIAYIFGAVLLWGACGEILLTRVFFLL